MNSITGKYNYNIKIYYKGTSCVIDKYMYYPSRVTTVLKILKKTYPDSDIVIYDRLGNRYTIDSWLSYYEKEKTIAED